MKKTIWDWYAPFYKQAMLPDKKSYQYMYGRISQVVKDKLVLEIATGPGLLAKHIAPAAKHITATDYSVGMIREAQKGENPKNLSFEVAEIRRVLKKDGILIAPNFVNHAKVGSLWTFILKIVGVSFEHHWTEETYLHYLASQGWKLTFHKSISARIPLCYAECALEEQKV